MTLNSEPSEKHCLRCGECCVNSSPTLHAADLHLIKERRIHTRDIYAIRPGELVRDNIRDQLTITDIELIKVKEKGAGKGCIHYDEDGKACSIYAHRPSQCSAFVCWDDRDFVRVYESPKLDRKEIIQDKDLLGLMAEHEKRCNYRELEKRVMRIETVGEKAVDEILAILRFDYELRPLVSEKIGVDPAEMDLVFGRPIFETIAMFGLKVVKEPDGSFFLTVDPNARQAVET